MDTGIALRTYLPLKFLKIKQQKACTIPVQASNI
jgi:hypothetical protein